MAEEAATALTSAIQSASLNRAPSPSHDLNPPTAATNIEPVPQAPPSPTASLSSSVLDHPVAHPRPRRANIPPLPDFRFEQSYLASLKTADTAYKVAWITVRDQVVLPLLQGTLYSLALHGWRHWNRGVKFRGEGIGARIRKWWWGVNNWEVPSTSRSGIGAGGEWAGFIPNLSDEKIAERVEDFYVEQLGSAVGD
ncbi:MAG: hypothetical protein Q9227_007329 [Pyrenula ochraceoflavens]